MDAGQAVLEQVMDVALAQARRYAVKAREGDEFAKGVMYACHDMLDVAKEVAGTLGLEFAANQLRDLNPDDLIAGQQPRQSAAA